MFRFASDIASYVDWTLLHLARAAGLRLDGRARRRLAAALSGWPGTRYEAKALAAGRKPTYLVVQTPVIDATSHSQGVDYRVYTTAQVAFSAVRT